MNFHANVFTGITKYKRYGLLRQAAASGCCTKRLQPYMLKEIYGVYKICLFHEQK